MMGGRWANGRPSARGGRVFCFAANDRDCLLRQVGGQGLGWVENG